MKSRYYILKDGVVTGIDNVLEWGRFFEKIENRRIDLTKVEALEVSTVFLGLDHGYDPDAPPVLFETMVFKDGHEVDCRRYCTYGEAHVGHWEIVEQLKSQAPENPAQEE